MTALMALAAGCATWRQPDPVETFELSLDQEALSQALAHYAHGLLLEGGRSDTQAAFSAFERAAERDPDSRLVRKALVKSLIRQGKPEAALEALQTIVSEHPTDRDAWLKLGRLAESLNRHETAADAYAQAEPLFPERFEEIRLARARCHFVLEQDDKAIALLLDMRNRKPSETVRAYLLHWTRQFLEQEAPARANAAVSAALTLGGTPAAQADMLTLRGDLNRLLNLDDEAARDYRRALDADASQPTPAFRLGEALKADKSTRRQLADQLAARPDDRSLLAMLAAASLAADKQSEALSYYARLYPLLIKSDYPPAQAFFQLYGGLLSELSRYEEAEAVYREGLENYPDNALMMNNLAYTLAERNRDLDLAYTLAQRALEHTPGNPAFLDTLGWIYYRKGRFAEALEHLEAALAKTPDDPVVLDHVGDALAALDRLPEAIDHWRRSVEQEPSPSVRDKLQRHQAEAAAAETPDRPLLKTPPAQAPTRPWRLRPDAPHRRNGPPPPGNDGP